MKLVNDFLSSPLTSESENVVTTNYNKNVSKLNSLFADKLSPYKGFMRLLPKIKENQIWTIKQQYMDYDGKIQKSSHPIMVIIVSGESFLDEDNSFVRVCPISPFIEMASASDQICSDSSVVGFPFLIESWNEQPLMAEILDKYVADYYIDNVNENYSVDGEISRFREIEISNARYLNHSIISYTNVIERSVNFSFSVDLNYQDYSKTKHMPLIGVAHPKLIDLSGNEEYATAAKMGNLLSENDCIEFVDKQLPFQLEIRKKAGAFVVTIIPKIEITLLNDKNEEILGNDNCERIVYDNLKRGIYNIKTPLASEIITIRLK